MEKHNYPANGQIAKSYVYSKSLSIFTLSY